MKVFERVVVFRALGIWLWGLPLQAKGDSVQCLHRQYIGTRVTRASFWLRVEGFGFRGHVAWQPLLMIEILHDLQDPKIWELWYIPYNGVR